MIDDQWTQSANPVVILSCIPNSESSRFSSMEIIRTLRLTQVTRPWQVSIELHIYAPVGYCYLNSRVLFTFKQ
jgi:hypothetical protein